MESASRVFTVRGRYPLSAGAGDRECGGFRLTIAAGEARSHVRLEWLRGVVPPGASAGEEDGDGEPLAEWRDDDDVVSFLALMKLAAAAREAPHWCEYGLEIPGGEWGEAGAPPCLHFWTDRAWVTMIAPTGPRRMQLRFDVVQAGGLLRPHFLRLDAEDLAAFGRELSGYLATLPGWAESGFEARNG